MRSGLLSVLIVTAVVESAGAQADVALCDIHSAIYWGSAGGISAYSIGTTSVNAGNVDLNWIQSGTDHPVISQNMYRYLDGRFEQIGQSWLKHSFCALQLESDCETGCSVSFACLNHLTPGCQDPYGASRNGSHQLLGPKWQVNAHTGEFSWPYAQGDQGTSGPLNYKRLQVHDSDLGIEGAQYIVEGQYVARDDALAGNQNNNTSYRYVGIAPAPSFGISVSALNPTQYQQPAIAAWPALEPGAVIQEVAVPDEGLFVLGHHATDNGDGTWHYEYALLNMNSDRSGGRFSLPLAVGSEVTGIGFHDVDYHSGDGPDAVNLDGTDWAAEVAGGQITWSTTAYAANPNANALRWATMVNFRFDADSPPTVGNATLGLFKPGSPEEIIVPGVAVPSLPPCFADLTADDTVGPADLAALLGDWGGSAVAADFNSDGIIGPADLAALLGSWGPCP